MPLRHSRSSTCSLPPPLTRLGQLDQLLARVGTAVQHHVFHRVAQVLGNLFVHAELAGVDDAHVHAGLYGVIQEHGVDGFAHRLVAAEGERHVGDAAGDLRKRQVLAYPGSRFDEVHRVVVVLLDARRNGEDVRVEDDVLGREADLFTRMS